MQPSPDRPERPELTSTGDRVVRQHLDAAERSVAALAADIDALGTQARGALAAMVGGETDTMDAAIADGNGLIARVRSETAAIRAELAAAPHVGTSLAPLYVSPELRERHATLQRVAAGRDGLDGRGRASPRAARRPASSRRSSRSTTGSSGSPPTGPSGEVQGGASRPSTPRRRCSRPRAPPRPARQHRGRRHARPVARAQRRPTTRPFGPCTKLTPTSASGSRRSSRPRSRPEKAARAHLPADTRGLVVIMSDIGQGGLNGG